MITPTTITFTAHDPKQGLTLNEVAGLLDHARTSGARGTEAVRVVTNVRGGLKKVTVTIHPPDVGVLSRDELDAQERARADAERHAFHEWGPK